MDKPPISFECENLVVASLAKKCVDFRCVKMFRFLKHLNFHFSSRSRFHKFNL